MANILDRKIDLGKSITAKLDKAPTKISEKIADFFKIPASTKEKVVARTQKIFDFFRELAYKGSMLSKVKLNDKFVKVDNKQGPAPDNGAVQTTEGTTLGNKSKMWTPKKLN